jgi:hypothetical protein
VGLRHQNLAAGDGFMTSRAPALIIERTPETEFVDKLEGIEFVFGRKRQRLETMHAKMVTKKSWFTIGSTTAAGIGRMPIL